MLSVCRAILHGVAVCSLRVNFAGAASAHAYTHTFTHSLTDNFFLAAGTRHVVFVLMALIVCSFAAVLVGIPSFLERSDRLQRDVEMVFARLAAHSGAGGSDGPASVHYQR